MCGIAGIINLIGKPIAREELKGMANSMAHRGPDGEGFFTEGNLGLAHKRLAILDVTEKGAQPMHSRNGEWVVVFNGCIYNFKELRSQLKNKGYSFHSNTDTEVLCEGLCEYGEDVFKLLNGMFAVAAFHRPSQTLYLSRDRYGIKPLYYFQSGSVFMFASEIKAFISHSEYKVELNLNALNEYFSFQNIFSDETLFKGVRTFPVGSTAKLNILKSDELLPQQWWDFDFSKPELNMSFEESIAETKRLMANAVNRQMVSDVPVGSYLSGGMDSASITGLASAQVKRLTTFTAGFDMSEVTGVEANYDERKDAELIANYFKTEHYEQVINAGDLSWSLPRVVWHLEDLRVGMSYPNYYISRLASKFVKVCLQGTGGDELYGGYPWRYYRVFQSLDKKTYLNNYYEFWQRLVLEQDKVKLFRKDVYDKIDVNYPRSIFEKVFSKNTKMRFDSPEDHVNNSLYFEIKTFLQGLFIVGDKLSMANGLEERFPFLDNDLVDFAQRIPVKYKLGNFEQMKRIDENLAGDKKKIYSEFNDGKNVLRKAMSELLPEKIINRKKQGFSAPDENWYRGENANYIKELLLDKNAAYREYIDPKYVAYIVNDHIVNRNNHRLLIWSFINFEWWCRLFLLNQKIPE